MYLFLSNPSAVYKRQYIDMILEWRAAGEDPVPWVLKLNYSNFDALISSLANLRGGVNLERGQVSCSTFWLVRSDGMIVGASCIRHRLNQRLSNNGGHIGYGIRPSQRRKGYGTEILKLTLAEAQKLGIAKARITCAENNVASEKIILKNGGVFDSKGVEDGEIIKRFWIRK